MPLRRSVLAIIAVVTVDTPVSCMERHRQYFPPAYILYTESVSHLLLLTNSSINFLIYCSVRAFTQKTKEWSLEKRRDGV